MIDPVSMEQSPYFASSEGSIQQSYQLNIRDLQVDGQGNYVDLSQKQIVNQYIAANEVKTRPLIVSSPYKGLKPFEPADCEHFFGREQVVDDLLEHLAMTNLLLLLGASGSGKSSVILAGLIPQLRRIKGNQFTAFTFKPDEDPFDALYSSLLSHFNQSEARIAREAHADTLMQVVQQLQPPDSYWLIFIDQFEELFVRSHPDKRDAFIHSLTRLHHYLSTVPNIALKLVMTMRADFSDRISRYPDLARITYNQNNTRLIADMHQDELRRAVEQPAALHGVVFEERLVDEMMAQVKGQPGYLPLLQYTLDLLWQRDDICDRTLNAASYHSLGGVRGALQQRIDKLYYFSQKAGTAIAFKQVLLKLVSLEGAHAIRRRADRREFEDNPVTSQIVTELIQEALLVSDLDGAGQRTVEIAHEALFTWSVFQTWVTEDGRAIALRNRLSDAVSYWLQALHTSAAEATAELYRGSTLDELLIFQREDTFDRLGMPLAELETRFLEASVQEQQDAATRQEREISHLKSAQRWSRSFIALLSLGLTITGGLLARPYYLRVRALQLGEMIEIPKGIAIIGSNITDHSDERPDWRIELESYWMNKNRISNRQYRFCVDAGFCKDIPDMREFNNLEKENEAVKVNAFQAAEYCNWLGQTLPTELQWERAVRGSEEEGGGEEIINFRFKATSTDGINDLMREDQWEITRTLASPELPIYGETYPRKNLWDPQSATEEDFIIIRGSDYDEVGNSFHSRFSYPPNNPSGNWGMRCVK